MIDKKVDHRFIIPKVTQRKEIKVGVMGFPRRATKELGEKICNEMVNGLVDYIELLNRNVF